MAEAKPFTPVKLICGIIASRDRVFRRAGERLIRLYGSKDFESPLFKFDFTDYYQKQMGRNLKRKFLSFSSLIPPQRLSEIKLQTNQMEQEIREELKSEKRVVNLDPGFLTASALIMATAKNYAHRIPLQHGIYGHLELLFTKKEVAHLSWTYPDYKTEGYQKFFTEVRKIYLTQLDRG
ncbi:MAG: DUF4416 family protein [Candidatus Aminicenantes bacterium]